jgi:hypothetical protein
VSEKSGINRNFNYFSYFYLQVKVRGLKAKTALTLHERVEIVLLIGRQGWTHRQVADKFNARHPERNQITQRSGETWLSG